MNDREFDHRMRRRAAQDKTGLTPAAEERLRDTIENTRTFSPKVDRAMLNGWKLASLPCLAVGIIMLLLIPHADVTDQGRIAQPPQQEISATLTPVMQPQSARAPQVQFEATYIKEKARVDGRFRNDTKDTWLIRWRTNGTRRLLWLEPGAECLDSVAWQAGGDVQELTWDYTGFRVTAKILHWVDGSVLAPGMEGYALQQDLMRDALDAGAIILSPGKWENGKAGPILLPLPEGCGVEDAVNYYVENGMLEDASALFSGEEKTYFEKRNFLTHDDPQA